MSDNNNTAVDIQTVSGADLAHSLGSIADIILPYGLKILFAIAIFVIGRLVARLVASAVRKLMVARGVETTLVSFLNSLIYSALLTFVIIAAIGQLGVQTASFVAVIGAAGLAVGLALQGSLSNFAAGVMMILFKPFKAGDFVEAAGIAGVVEEIMIFSTRMRTGDNKEVIVPNGAIIGGAITNYSAKPTRRIDLVIGVAYDADLAQTKKILESVCASDERVLNDPETTVAVSELGDSSVNFVVRPWVKTDDYWPARFALTEEIKNKLDEAGIGIPFPQMDLHVVDMPSKA